MNKIRVLKSVYNGNSPYRNLWVHCLMQVLSNLQQNRRLIRAIREVGLDRVSESCLGIPGATCNLRNVLQDINWISSSDDDIGSFVWICKSIGIPRYNVLLWINNQKLFV